MSSLGKGQRAIGTPVERSTRYVMLFPFPEGRGASAVGKAPAKRIAIPPTELLRSITWDQGQEMAELRFTVDTDVRICFCDPKSPWQLPVAARIEREHERPLAPVPKGSEFSVPSRAHLNAVARERNGRPRRTLGRLSPPEAFAEAAASTG